MDIEKLLKDGIYTATLSGKFTFFDHAVFREILEDIAPAQTQRILLDITGLTFIDSAGLGQLLLAHDEAVKYKKPMVIRGATGQVKKMFDVAHFENVFTLE